MEATHGLLLVAFLPRLIPRLPIIPAPYPEYKLTWPIDTLRKREYERLKQTDEVYMDYMGASLYPEGLVRSNSTFLCQAILGNTHSFSTR